MLRLRTPSTLEHQLVCPAPLWPVLDASGGKLIGALALLTLLASCGGESSGVGTGLTFDYQLFRRGQNVSCDAAPEVREVMVTLFLPSSGVPRAGWPRTVDCTGRFEAPDVEPGRHVVQVEAVGDLQGDPAAVLYEARTEVTLPEDGDFELSLEPEIAFLDLSWSFGSDMLAPCATEVASVDLIVAAGSGDPFMASYDCQASPVSIEMPFAVQSYAIRLTANSAEGFPLFDAEARHTLEPGVNPFNLVLMPQGGRVLLDFSFVIGPGLTTRMCDDPNVMADEVTATLHNLEGGFTVEETFACDEPRPYAFRSARFTAGRMLELELVAEADVARFKAVERFTMPEGDRLGDLISLEPVGTASVSVLVSSSTCAGDVDRFEVAVTETGGSAPILEEEILPPASGLTVVDLPYGDYQIDVAEVVNGQILCTARGIRTIEGRENDWDPFLF